MRKKRTLLILLVIFQSYSKTFITPNSFYQALNGFDFTLLNRIYFIGFKKCITIDRWMNTNEQN